MVGVVDLPGDGACPRSAAAFKQDGEGGEETAAARELVGDVELLDDDLAGAEQRDVGGFALLGSAPAADAERVDPYGGDAVLEQEPGAVTAQVGPALEVLLAYGPFGSQPVTSTATSPCWS